jgi:hypothetical protein
MHNKIKNNIITTLGINNLPVEQQKEAMERLGGIVYQEVVLRALEKMDDEDKKELEEAIAKTPDPEIVISYLSDKVPDLEKMISEEAEKLREESAEIMSEIGK